MKIDSNAFKELKVFAEEKFKNGSANLSVISAYPLSEEEKNVIVSFLKKQGLANLNLEEKIDKEILGGIILVAGSTEIDLSLRGQLANLKKDLYEIT